MAKAVLVLGVKKLRGMHRVVSSKHPRALGIHEPHWVVGVYTEKLSAPYQTRASSKMGGGRLHGDGCLLGQYGTCIHFQLELACFTINPLNASLFLYF